MAINTIQVFDLDGVATRFPVTFEYLARKFVKVTLLGTARRPLTLVTEFVFEGGSTINTLRPWGPLDGYNRIEIRRETSASERIVNFNDATILRAGDLNASDVQALHVAEEARDGVSDAIGTDAEGNLDAKFRRVINVADPVSDGDAVNKRSMNREYSGIYAAAQEALMTAWDASNVANGLSASISQANVKADEAKTAAEANLRWIKYRRVSIRDFGAVPLEENASFDSGPAIESALAFVRANGGGLDINSGTFLTSRSVVLRARDSIWGFGQSISAIQLTGSAIFQSGRTATVDYVDLRDFKLIKGGTTDVGLDVGTCRRGNFMDMAIEGFKVGVNLDMGVSLVANYWNRFINIEASCPSRTLAGSVGFQLGNSVNVTYPDTDYNVLIGCKSFTCETAIKMTNAIGCTITGHQATVVGNALVIESGNNNRVEIYAENCTNMGSSTNKGRANHLTLYNDGGLATPFADSGWNFHTGQIIGIPFLENDSREIDTTIRDRVFTSFTPASKKVCSVFTPERHASYTITLAYSGYTSGRGGFSGISVFDVTRVALGTPVATKVRGTGSDIITAIASFNGTMEFNIAGFAGSQTVCNTCVEIMGFQSVEANPYGKSVVYTRLPA